MSTRRSPRILTIALTIGIASGATACNNTATGQKLEWSILDRETNANTVVPAGGSATIDTAHSLVITLRVADPAGIKEMSVWGDGNFKCSTALDSNYQYWDAPGLLPASLPKQVTPLPGTSSTTGFVQTPFFVYRNLDCGVHIYNQMTTPLDFTVVSGTLHLHGSETNGSGNVVSATLDLSP